ncbi:40s ribosomal protein s5-1 [Hordeum vulgare]|nr:40s ribosomal protein s5-1 [Hordeum vulgare]
MRQGMFHIRDVEGLKKTGSMETKLEAMVQQVFKCQGMVERGLNANHMMIMEFTNKHKMDAIDIGKHLSRLYDRVDQLQGQIYDLQNQNFRFGYCNRKANEVAHKLAKIVSFSIRKDWGWRSLCDILPINLISHLVSSLKQAEPSKAAWSKANF